MSDEIPRIGRYVPRLAAARLGLAMEQLRACHLCPRRCGANRLGGESGWCGAPARPEYVFEYVHYGEEVRLTPSHTVYLTGCNLACVFCHTAKERARYEPIRLTGKRLRSVLERGRDEGARNLNLLGGEPLVNLPGLLALFAGMDELPPVVWNTNLYSAEGTLDLLVGIPDTYLIDMKFGNDRCAIGLSGALDYSAVVRRRLHEVYTEEGPERVIVRHLVLPGHVDCCTRPVLEWAAAELPGASVNLIIQYLPAHEAHKHGGLGRFLAQAEIDQARQYAEGSGLRLEQAGLIPHGAGRAGGPSRRTASGGAEPSQGTPPLSFILSPRGEIVVRHPTRDAVLLAAGLTSEPGEGRG